MKASEIARLVGGTFEGDSDPDLSGVAPLDRAGPRDLAFLAHPRYLEYLPAADAGALLLAAELAERVDASAPLIRVTDVHGALTVILPLLYPEQGPEPGVHSTAVVEDGASLGSDVSVGPYTVIGRGSRLGDRVTIAAHVVIGQECIIGDDVAIHPHVTLYRRVRVGARSVVKAGARLGSDGFGFARVGGTHRKIPQVGDCEIGADVEIGANCTVDRGSVGTTRIGDGSKVDNLVHIGHNVRIGDGSIVVAQVGVSGSTVIGRGVTLGGQAGLNGHIEIGDGATIAAQAGVFGDVPARAVYSGYPARPHKEALRAQAGLFRLPQIIKRIRALERAILGREGPDR